MALFSASSTRPLPGLLAGFLAGALSVALFHQGMFIILGALGLFSAAPWSMRPVPPFAVPWLLNAMFWGGLWGVVYVAVAPYLPVANAYLRGIVFGLLGPFLLGAGILVPLIKGGALLFGLDPMRILNGGLIASAFGLGIAVLLPIILRLVARGTARA